MLVVKTVLREVVFWQPVRHCPLLLHDVRNHHLRDCLRTTTGKPHSKSWYRIMDTHHPNARGIPCPLYPAEMYWPL